MTPTDNVLNAANQCFTATASDGRVVVARKLTALDKLRVLKAAGPVLADNQAWLGVAMLAASVSEIDGIPVPRPVSEQQIEALVGRLGDPGLDAAASALSATDTPIESAAGNSQGTPT